MRLQTSLYSFQQRAVEKLMPSRVGGLFMEMGTGKTRTAIELVVRRRERIDRAVWFCPVALRETVAAEIRKHTDASDEDIYVFDERTRMKTLPLGRTWYVVGIESMSSSTRVVLAANRLITTRSFVIVDESSYIKTHWAKRTQRITRVAEKARYRLILTGTPLSQGVVDLYAQMQFLSPRILGYRSFYSFARNHLEYSKQHKGLIVLAHNVPWLAAKIAPYTYQVTKAECLDLPDKLYDSVYYGMTREQSALYDRAKEEILLEVDDEEITSTTIYRLFTALQEIVCGYWQRTPDERIEVGHLRVDMLRSVLRALPAGAKAVVWARYHYSIGEIVPALEAEFGAGCTAQFHGGLGDRARMAELTRFRGPARFLVATQATGGHGLTLTEAHHVVFYANSFKYAERVQAEDRCHRIGQTQPVTYIDLVCVPTIDQRIERALARKEDVVTAFRREVEEMRGLKRGELREAVKARLR